MLFNKTTGKKIIQKVLHADTPWLRLKGLMFEDRKRFNYALVFTLPRQSVLHAAIHTLFVFFPIDVVYLNNKKKVVDIVRGLQPFNHYYAPKKAAKFFVELPAGKSAGIQIGHTLEW